MGVHDSEGSIAIRTLRPILKEKNGKDHNVHLQPLVQPQTRTSPPRQPPVEPGAPGNMNAPGCSGIMGRPTTRPDNVYGNRCPVDILADLNEDFFQSETPQDNQSPGPSGDGSGNDQRIDSPDLFVDLAK